MKKSIFGLITIIIEGIFAVIGVIYLFLIPLVFSMAKTVSEEEYGYTNDSSSDFTIIVICFSIIVFMIILATVFSLMAYINNNYKFAIVAFVLAILPMLIIIPLIGALGLIFAGIAISDIKKCYEDNMRGTIQADLSLM